MKTNLAFLTVALAGAVAAYGGFDLLHEHNGDVFQYVHAPGSGLNGVIHDGKASGTYKKIDGETLYVSYPPGRHRKSDAAILYLTDIAGVQLINARLLADSLARAGYLVVVPDLFRGDPVPVDAFSNPNSTFDLQAWFARHPINETEKIINSALKTMKTKFNAKKIGSVGYCFGGRFVARYLAASKGIDAGFCAHPSNTQTSEWQAVTRPISVAFGALDESNTAANRTNIEEIFQSGNKTYQTALYSNAEHGFAVRTDLSNKQKALAQESAYFQAVKWLDAWVKDK